MAEKIQYSDIKGWYDRLTSIRFATRRPTTYETHTNPDGSVTSIPYVPSISGPTYPSAASSPGQLVAASQLDNLKNMLNSMKTEEFYNKVPSSQYPDFSQIVSGRPMLQYNRDNLRISLQGIQAAVRCRNWAVNTNTNNNNGVQTNGTHCIVAIYTAYNQAY